MGNRLWGWCKGASGPKAVSAAMILLSISDRGGIVQAAMYDAVMPDPNHRRGRQLTREPSSEACASPRGDLFPCRAPLPVGNSLAARVHHMQMRKICQSVLFGRETSEIDSDRHPELPEFDAGMSWH